MIQVRAEVKAFAQAGEGMSLDGLWDVHRLWSSAIRKTKKRDHQITMNRVCQPPVLIGIISKFSNHSKAIPSNQDEG